MKTTLSLILFFLLNTVAFSQESLPLKPVDPIIVDFKPIAFLFVNSTTGRGSFDQIPKFRNFPKTITPAMNAPQNAVSLIVKPSEEAVFAEKYKGVKLLLINATDENVGFATVDHRIYIIQEALNAVGEWKAIEGLPNVRCGFGKYTMFLQSNEYWEFAAPRYSGEIKTKLRFRLYKERPEREQAAIYSNEFEGYVDTRQFTEVILPK